MAKYHINSRGEAGRCGAMMGRCPFGGDENHAEVGSAAEARAWAEEKLAESYGVTGLHGVQRGSTAAVANQNLVSNGTRSMRVSDYVQLEEIVAKIPNHESMSETDLGIRIIEDEDVYKNFKAKELEYFNAAKAVKPGYKAFLPKKLGKIADEVFGEEQTPESAKARQLFKEVNKAREAAVKRSEVIKSFIAIQRTGPNKA